MNPHEKIDALLALISSAAHDAVADYEKRGYEVPSLSSSKAHPTDSEVATLALKKSIRVLEGACEQLCTTLAPTTHTSLNVSELVTQTKVLGSATDERHLNLAFDARV